MVRAELVMQSKKEISMILLPILRAHLQVYKELLKFMTLKVQCSFGLVIIPCSGRHAAWQCPLNLQVYLSSFIVDAKTLLQFPSTTILFGSNI